VTPDSKFYRLSGGRTAARPCCGTTKEFCAARGLTDVEIISEIGGGLNFRRKKFVALMQAIDRFEVHTLVIAHKDRLVRFGFEWFAQFCADHGCQPLVLNQETLSPEQEMVQYLMTIVHCFSSRLYGLRNYRKTLTAALKGPTA
jgi:predicted site-specific integrase-resolvase